MADKIVKVAPYNLLDCLSTNALKSLLQQDLNDSEDGLAPETIEYIVHLLEERNEELASARKAINVDLAWQRFAHDGISLAVGGEDLMSLVECAATPKGSDFQDSNKKKRAPKFTFRFVLRGAGIIAATVCILFTVMISVQAAGFDVFGAIARWTDETFHFDVYSEYEANTKEDKGDLDSAGDILAAYSLDRELAPTWYPTGYTMSDIEVHQDDGSLKILYSCVNEAGKYFSVQVLKYEDTDELSSYIIEKSNEDVEILNSHGKQFYILTNEDTITATWSDGHILETVSGNLSKEDLFQIIKSIGGK